MNHKRSHFIFKSFLLVLLGSSLALISAVVLLAGVMKLLHSDASWDKSVFLFALLGISFFVSLISITLA